MRKLIGLVLFSFFALTLSAQLSSTVHWQHLTTSDQLSNSSNSFLFKDSKGFLWIGSSYGLQRYDGHQLKNYGSFPIDSSGMLGKNIQGQIIEDEDQNLWITTYQSPNFYEVATEKFTPYPMKGEDGNVQAGFHSCGKSDNTIFFLHKDSLRRFDVKTRKFTAADELLTNNKEKFNRGLVRQFGDTTLVYVYRLNSGSIKIVEFLEGVLTNTRQLYFDEEEIHSIYPISKNQFLLGCESSLREVSIDDSKKGEPVSWRGKSLHQIIKINGFDKNKVLISTVDGDIFYYNFCTKKVVGQLNFTDFKKINPDNKLLTALVDDDHNIWVSSRSDGIYFTHPDKIKFSNLLAGREVTNLVQRRNGEIWVFTNKNIVVLNEDGDIVKEIESDQPNADNMMAYHVILDKKDRIWTSYYYQSEKIIYPDSYDFVAVENTYLFYGIALRDGRVIFAKAKNIFTGEKEDGTLGLVKVTNTDEIAEVLYLYQNTRNEIVMLQQYTELIFYDPVDFSKKRSFSYNGEINNMFERPGDSILWIGGIDGLVSFNYNTENFTYHSQGTNLPNQVFGILPDEAGNLWLSSNSGIYRFNPVSKEIVSYNEADGIGNKVFSKNASCKLRDGRLAFGGENGLIIFDPKTIQSKIPLAVPQITNILIDGKRRADLTCIATNATNVEEIKKLELAPEDNKLEFHFISKEYSNTPDNQIRYRLFPEEQSWQTVASGGKCQYTNLEPGKYKFEVQAANSDGIWNTSNVDILELNMLPPFKKTWTFFFIVLGGLIVIIYKVVNFFQNQKRKKEQAVFEKNMALEKQRLRIARDMHDDLGSRLSAISLKTSMLENKFEHPAWKKEMEKLTTDAQEISITIRETIWAVDARNDTLDKLTSYLTSYTEQLFDDLHIEYDIKMADGLPEEQMVSGKIRRMVFLAYKEILNNIIKHAGAKEVLIEMKMEKEHFILIVTDDGIGFDLAEKEKGSGNGLDNMRYRMEKIGGICRFLTVAKGTSIELNFNFLD